MPLSTIAMPTPVPSYPYWRAILAFTVGSANSSLRLMTRFGLAYFTVVFEANAVMDAGARLYSANFDPGMALVSVPPFAVIAFNMVCVGADVNWTRTSVFVVMFWRSDDVLF